MSEPKTGIAPAPSPPPIERDADAETLSGYVDEKGGLTALEAADAQLLEREGDHGIKRDLVSQQRFAGPS